jgi:hypothetical protein
MQSSRGFELKIKQAHKHKRENADFDLENSIADSFCLCFSGSEPMAREIYDYFYPNFDKMMAVIDLYNGDLNLDEATDWTEEDYATLIELTNRFSGELELHQIQGVMQFFMDAKML